MLFDSFGRVHDYLRISVTDRCNLRCTYCMPPDGVTLQPKSEILEFEEIEALARIFIGLGVRKIRITGGEPLVRRGIEELLASIGRLDGLEEFALSTNAVLLIAKLPAIWNSGVTQLNISLDTLRPDRFKRIALRENLNEVLEGIASAAIYSLPGAQGFNSIKLNTVVMRGINDDELSDLIEFGEELAHLTETAALTGGRKAPEIHVRFIEFMPFRSNGWDEDRCVSSREMIDSLAKDYLFTPTEPHSGIQGPASMYNMWNRRTGKALNCRAGFISTMSDQFCGGCNRLRLTTDGNFRTCLFGDDSMSLRDLLRAGASRVDMENAIRAALLQKWEKHPGASELIQIGDRDMVMIGG